ncbi:MAG TPA: hypothetical protein VIV55_04885 [Flavobacterium sp.]
MKSFFSLIFASSLILISCKKELEPQDSSIPTEIAPVTETANIQQNQTVMQNQTLQNQNTINQNVVNQSTTVATPVSVAKGMNPAHGQPNHRCDIPVGAPLNSPIAKPKTTPVVPQQNNVVSTTATPSIPATLATPTTPETPTPEGMNPPHGQAGHRCDIAVGAPLPKE